MNKKKMKDNLGSQLIKVTIFPLLVMVVVITVISLSMTYSSMLSQVKKELQKDTDLVVLLYDEVYSGDFSFLTREDGQEAIIYKGSRVISGENSMFQNLADMLDIEISLFYQNTRILTTLENQEGGKAIGTQAAYLVEQDVLKNGQSHFYKDVTVYGEKCFAYYKPMIAKDGTVYGMIGVCRNSSEVRSGALKNIWPTLLAGLFMVIVVCIIIARYISKVTARIKYIDSFMNTLANGDFDAAMPGSLMECDDEIKRLAIDGRQMASSIKRLVECDALTGLNNRRYGGNKLAEIINRSSRTGVPYSVSIGDIDYFKKVNDTYGHEMGDEILIKVSECLKKGMQKNGFVARWGGEEFLLVFDSSDVEEARVLALKILNEIRKIEIPGTGKFITMSFGITQGLPDEENMYVVVKRADDNLYEAKETGRNQIIAK